MRPKSLRRWLTACLLGSALAGGCRNAESKPTDNRYPPMLSKAPAGTTSKGTAVASTVATAKTQPPVVAVATKTPVADPIPPTLDLPPLVAEKPVAAAPAAEKPALTPVRYEEPVKPVAAADTAPRPNAGDTSSRTFGHSEDYSRLSGQIQQFGRSWRLRYASLDEDDAHGGSVTLEDDARLEALKDGQFVRVQGLLFEGEGRRGATHFRIRSLETVQP